VTRITVEGAGAVGARVARQLASSPQVDEVVVVDVDLDRAEAVVASMAAPAVVRLGDLDQVGVGSDVLVVAVAPGAHRDCAERGLERGAAIVSTSDGEEDVRSLLALDAEARERGLTVVVGAGFAPGLTDVLAAHAAVRFDTVDEIHVASVGTGGPSCARQHHRALAGEALDWRDGAWLRRRAGSGRELCWFPDPVGPEDCYRAAIPDALLLVPVFPGVQRVTARMGANRRDRFTARLPMLRPPHAEGGIGAVRVEVRGRRGTVRDVAVLGAMDRPAVAAGAVAAVAAAWVAEGRLRGPGALGLAALAEPGPFLAELARRGVKAATFEGTTAD
jgi:saccharopine dehydrogenase-like NADP-dependent oxidoreductase